MIQPLQPLQNRDNMKALKRNEKEIVKETDGIAGINWINGEPLTRPEWAGGPYTLIENYVEPEIEPEGHTPVLVEEEAEAEVNEPVEDNDDEIVINGVVYKKV